MVLLLLLEYVEHLLGVKTFEACVEAADALTLVIAWERSPLLCRVGLHNHQVNDVVTSHVSQTAVLVPQLAPDSQVTQRLVHVLMQDDEG